MKSACVLLICLFGFTACFPQSQDSPPPDLECGPLEEPVCVFDCPSERTCQGRWVSACCAGTSEPCKFECRCKEGYIRNIIEECITYENCERCDNDERREKYSLEYFTCGGACDNVCSTLASQNQTNCPTKTEKCKEDCYCFPDHARNDQGKCVPISECTNTTEQKQTE